MKTLDFQVIQTKRTDQRWMILLNDFIFDWHLLRELELTDMPINAIGKNT